jgi:D-3-phosphoglycerate dehydrogenase
MTPDALPKPLAQLLETDKVVFTPHVAGWTAESRVKLASVLAEKILEAFPGHP